MPAVLATRPTATKNSPFLPQRWPKPPLLLIAHTHGGMARLSGLENTGMAHLAKVVTNPSTNRARRSLTLLTLHYAKQATLALCLIRLSCKPRNDCLGRCWRVCSGDAVIEFFVSLLRRPSGRRRQVVWLPGQHRHRGAEFRLVAVSVDRGGASRSAPQHIARRLRSCAPSWVDCFVAGSGLRSHRSRGRAGQPRCRRGLPRVRQDLRTRSLHLRHHGLAPL